MIGSKLQRAFRKESKGARGEIQLFRAFIRAFNALGPDALSKEYHGNRYQVTFKEARGAGRPIPRCELCDVMIIHYPANNPNAARITFNQAKVTTNTLGGHHPKKTTGPDSFGANLEQWDLLSNRPSINPATKTFHPPLDLLSGATLPSVGTFGVFYPSGPSYDFAYYVANGLTPLTNSDRRSGTLQWTTPLNVTRSIAGHEEVTGTCCLLKFGDALEQSLIGTPIRLLMYGPAKSAPMRAWLTRILVSLSREHPDSELPDQLLSGLELRSVAEDEERKSIIHAGEPSPPRAVILIRTQGNSSPYRVGA
jgi:hypothetical protein